MTSIIRPFKDYLYQVGYSENMQYMLPALVHEFIAHQGITDVRCIARRQVQSFCAWLEIRPLKRRTGALSDRMIGHYVYALKTFFSWLEVTGQADYNPISGMKFKKAAQNIRRPLSLPQIRDLFAAAATLQEVALLHLFYSCGLRRSEGEALDIKDVHFREQLLYVRAGKGARRRVIPLTQKVAADLQNYYLGHRCHARVILAKDKDAFILNHAGRRMRGLSYMDLLKRMAHKAGITGEVTLHQLRHSIATHLLRSGMSMEYVRDFLGHRHLESTQVYAKPDTEQLKRL